MAELTHIKQLSPLDLTVPTAYINIVLAFDTTEPTPAISKYLQVGLDALSKQLPWLSGRVCASQVQQKPSLEIRYNPNTALTLTDKGSIAGSYETLSSQGMPPEAIPQDAWPLLPVIDDALAKAGAPVFATSAFRFADRGVGLCVSLHHNTVDATGFSEIMRQWARNITGSGLDIARPTQFGRIERLSEALSPQLKDISALSYEDLLAKHPEYAKKPPAVADEPVQPTETPPCTSKVFTIRIHSINTIKQALGRYTPTPPTTNVILCALLWTAITRARAERNPSLAESATSRLATIVNGRRRVSETFAPASNPYFGNVVLYTRTEATADTLTNTRPQSPESAKVLLDICTRITTSQSPSTISARHIAEVYRLIADTEDHRTLDPGWDIFGSRDLAITSWADLDLYEVDFGVGLGRPEFVRLPYMEADGVAVLLPRRRDGVDERLEVMVLLRKDDMAVLERDEAWMGVATGVGNDV
ncbi:hypothetical protein ASPVEDRAFT_47998 [Aspergillus versicolor CBS 583.65]|uniref:Uncharacterized protein n=1 Tax=Aspergillus versicolor CBS 583.65 TaxID=1036611 RepID=A0A1L9Q568_ASPVE|nr:uncharacterized protein ASPVEDRAFT_47998 [Aspergillus versicolor CBS 583.65]OJJ08848.1 hypothetical protein ASPVEDRAFT_47998 [Aspergillus versicolor CBS 583.65]